MGQCPSRTLIKKVIPPEHGHIGEHLSHPYVYGTFMYHASTNRQTDGVGNDIQSREDLKLESQNFREIHGVT